MEVRCAICGKRETITDVHKDYERLEKNPKSTYFCEICSARIQYDALEYNKPKKPIG